jgi:hypothetical protein
MRKIYQKDSCREWLELILKDGPVRSDIIHAEAYAQGYSRSTLYRMAKELDVTSTSINGEYGRHSAWSL